MRNRMRTVPLLILLMITAGCIGLNADDEAPLDQAQKDPITDEALSQPIHTLESIQESWIPSHDDTVLHAAEYHPNTTDKRPVIIILSPYWGNLAPEAQASNADDYFVELFVERGYTLVHASVRGTGYSGGCYQLGGPLEVQDAAEIVDHYANAEFSNGNVGMIGASYPGTTPWQAAIEDPDGLATIVPIAGITDMYRYMYKDGAAYTHGPIFPTYYTAAVSWANLAQNADTPDHVLPLVESFCPDVAENVSKGYETWITGDHDAFWDERNYEDDLENVNVPVFLVHGLQDWNVNPDNGLPLYEDLPQPKKAMLGQWAHNYPHATGDEATDRPDWNRTLIAWMDQWLKEHDTGILDEPPVLVQDTEHRWQNATTWPPQGTQPETYHLALNGTLHPAPTTETGTLTMGPYPGGAAPNPPEEIQDATGDETLTFTSPPLTQDTTLTGQPTLHVNVSTNAPDGHLVAHLYKDDGDQQEWLGLALLNLAHRDTRHEGTPMPLGEAQHIQLTFFPMHAHVKEGERLILDLQPEDTAWIHPHPHKPTYTFHFPQDEPNTFTLDTLTDVDTHEAPEKGDVLWSS